MKNIYHSFLPSTKYKRFCRLYFVQLLFKGHCKLLLRRTPLLCIIIQKKVLYCEAGCTIGEWDNNDIIRCDNRTLFLR